MKENNWKNFDLCQSNCPLKESYQKNFDFCLSNFPLKESNRKNFDFCQSCLIQDNCLTLKRSPWIENHLFRDQYSKPTLTSCKSVDWLNFWTVKRLTTIAIFRRTSLPIVTLWVPRWNRFIGYKSRSVFHSDSNVPKCWQNYYYEHYSTKREDAQDS